ncbi:MAG TPA: hypothetical protein VN969_14030 [Streptosporangiaceae bacterium]|jgi:hypothetical protein|nr:hypothetical protein [Streptosporangiaceae bacterium]
MNFNDAQITSLYVGEDGSVADVQDDAPNAPAAKKFRVTLEMVAGGGVAGPYELITTCSDLTDTAPAAALNPPAPLNGPGTFGGVEWQVDTGVGPTDRVFKHTQVIAPPKVRGHVYRYTAALRSTNGQIVSIRQSDPFILL